MFPLVKPSFSGVQGSHTVCDISTLLTTHIPHFPGIVDMSHTLGTLKTRVLIRSTGGGPQWVPDSPPGSTARAGSAATRSALGTGCTTSPRRPCAIRDVPNSPRQERSGSMTTHHHPPSTHSRAEMPSPGPPSDRGGVVQRLRGSSWRPMTRSPDYRSTRKDAVTGPKTPAAPGGGRMRPSQ